jgi:hypothetical protein
MRWIRFCFTALLAIFAQFLIPAAAQAKWLRAETPNFVVYSTGSDKELRRFATNLERFHAMAQFAFKVDSTPNPNKLTVYFLGTQEAVAKLAGDKSGMVAGFYSARDEGSFAVANRSKADNMFDLGGMTVLFHEYTHHFMFRHFSYSYPSWYVEGFAEYLSTATFEDKGSWTVGKPAYHRAYSLLEGPKVPIERLLFSKVSDLKPGEMGPFYGRSWLLVHMLNMKPEYKGKLKIYFEAIAAGKTHREAATTAFGDLAALDKALDRYLESKISYLGSDKPVAADTIVTVTPLSDLAGQVIAIKMDRLRGGLDAKGMAALAALAAANPGDAEVWYELAKAKHQDSEFKEDKAARKAQAAEAEGAVDKALAINPNHARANVLKAQILFARLEDARDSNASRWSAARMYLITANKNATEDPLVLLTWFDSFGMQGRTPGKVARDGLLKAFELAPEVIEIRVKLAFDLASQGKFDEALGLVEFLAQHPHYSAQGQELVEQIKKMRDRKFEAEEV